MLALSVVAFGVAWWLGLYLIGRDPGKRVLWLTGIGLLGYALGMACAPLGLPAAQRVLLTVPGLAWTGVLGLLVPTPSHRWERLGRVWAWTVVPLALLAAVLAGWLPWAGLVAAALVLVPLGSALWVAVRQGRRLRPGRARGLLIVATLFFALSCVAMLPVNVLPLHSLSLDGLPAEWGAVIIAGMGLDLVLLGLAVAVFDAFDEGQALRADMARSLLAAAAVTVLFGGQVVLAMALLGAAPPLVALLFGVVAAGATVTVLGGRLQAGLDRLALRPGVRRERAELRAVADALPRRSGIPALADLADEAEFARLTRRALSNYGDLAKLVTSPLTELTLIDDRLAARNATGQPLQRAAELKAVLGEAIEALRPRGAEGFGTTEEWRYYNALYFPYVLGVRPYRQLASRSGLTAEARRAFDYFAAHVPERTLHNWQNAAARLIAADLRLRERELAAHGSARSGRGSRS